MVSIAHNKSLFIAPPAATRLDSQSSGTLGQPATECGREVLQAAKDRFKRQLAWNQRSMNFGLLLGLAALAFCAIGAIFPPIGLWRSRQPWSLVSFPGTPPWHRGACVA